MIGSDEIRSAYPDLAAKLAKYDPLKSAAAIAGLQAMPAVRPYDFRLETLVRLVIAVGHGKKLPRNLDLDSWLAELGEGFCGLWEDPPESVSIFNICTGCGNRRTIEGSWDLPGFHLQRFVDVLEGMPDDAFFQRLKQTSFALLNLSEAVAARANAARFTSFDDDPRDKKNSAEFGSPADLGALVEFSNEQLATLGIEPEHLEPFALQFNGPKELQSGDTTLERRPVIAHRDKFFLILPSSVSSAIRLFVIETLQGAELLGELHRALAASYRILIRETPILGEHFYLPIRFQERGGLAIAQLAHEVDHRRWISLTLIVDNFSDFTGSLEESAPREEFERVLANSVGEFHKQFSENHTVEDGIHIIVVCGWGRLLTAQLPEPAPGWRMVHISAADLITMSLTPRTKSLDLWRLLDSEQKLDADGVSLQNASGLLNLYAFWKQTSFRFLPDLSGTDGRLPNLVAMPTDSLFELRKQVYAGFDERMVEDIDGSHVRVRRKSIDPLFQDTDEIRLSICVAELGRRLRGVVESDTGRAWWCEVECEGATQHERYKHWEAACGWLSRAVDALEKQFYPTLPNRAILWRIVIEGDGLESHSPKDSSGAKPEELLEVTTSKEPNIIEVTARPEFYLLWNNPENIAERGLVAALVKGVALLASDSWDDDRIDALTSEIVPNADARYTHGFSVPQFSDYFREQLGSNTTISKADEAFVNYGLVWKAGFERSIRRVESRDACLELLSNAVQAQWSETESVLKALDRRSVLTWLLTNHEALRSEQLQWERTMRAQMSLYGKTNSVVEIATEYLSAIFASRLACRLLIEMAACECSESSGNTPGELELTRLLARTISIFQLGSWSDAIHDEILDAELAVTPAGEIIPKSDLAETVIHPLAKSLQSTVLNREAARYEKHYNFNAEIPDTATAFESEFVEAFATEYGCDLNDLSLAVAALEQFGIERESPIFVLNKDGFCGLKANEKHVPSCVVETLLDRFTTKPRTTWAEPPPGFENRDIKPWRFRRRLSSITRPIVQLDESAEPSYLVAPGLVRESLVYNLRSAYEAHVDESHFKSKKMQGWIGSQRNRLGHAFNDRVAKKLTAFGWKAKSNRKLSEILNRKMRDFGDVDVLAWNSQSPCVYAIECKDFGFAKTHAEVGSYLRRFRGETDSKGRPDELLMHLNRCAILEKHLSDLSRYVGKVGKIEVIPLLVFSQPSPVIYRVPIGIPEDSVLTFGELEQLVLKEGRCQRPS